MIHRRYVEDDAYKRLYSSESGQSVTLRYFGDGSFLFT